MSAGAATSGAVGTAEVMNACQWMLRRLCQRQHLPRPRLVRRLELELLPEVRIFKMYPNVPTEKIQRESPHFKQAHAGRPNRRHRPSCESSHRPIDRASGACERFRDFKCYDSQWRASSLLLCNSSTRILYIAVYLL